MVGLTAGGIFGGIALADRDKPVPKPDAVKPAAVKPTPKKTPATPRVAEAKDFGRPERLTIRSIGVSAPVTLVGTTADGAQDVPKSLDDAGWWRDGVQPGRAGNAVVVGHTASSADGVFDDLGKLRRGDDIEVRSAGGTLHYDVTRKTSVKVAAFNRIAPLVYSPGGRPGLVLMTCGDWNGKRFESTTIVFSTLATD